MTKQPKAATDSLAFRACPSDWVDVPRRPKPVMAWSAEQTAEFVDHYLNLGGHTPEVEAYFLALKGRA